MSRLRVAVDARPLTAVRTGVETFLAKLIEQWVKTDTGLSLDLLVDHTWQAPWNEVHCRAVYVPSRVPLPRPLGDSWMLIDVPRALRRDPPDVFFSASTKFPPGAVPSVVTVHDLGWRGIPDAYRFQERVRQYLWTRWATLHAARLLTVSQFTRDDLVAWVPECAARVRVVHEAAPDSWRAPETSSEIASTLQRFGLRKPFLLTVGTLSPKKNLEALIRGFDLVRREHLADHELVIVGKVGWKARAILRAATQVQGVRLVGYVEDGALRALYSAARLFVSASLYEGFGLPVLEAMACGAPVLAANAGALPEIVGDAGLLCEPTAAGIAGGMQRLLLEPGLAASLRSKGRRRAAEFSWERSAQSIRTVLQEAAESKGKG